MKFVQAENNWSHESVICELTKRISEREAELRAVTRQKTVLEGKISSGVYKGGSIQVERAYESLLAHLGEREEQFRFVSQKNEHMSNRQNELERVIRELQATMNFQRCLLQEKDEKMASFERKQKAEKTKVQRQIQLALECQRETLREKEQTAELLAASEENVKNLTLEINKCNENEKAAIEKAEEHATVVEAKDQKINTLESKVSELSAEIRRIKEREEESKRRVEEREATLRIAKNDISELNTQVDQLTVSFRC
jgi:chromosome segregation ATPase